MKLDIQNNRETYVLVFSHAKNTPVQALLTEHCKYFLVELECSLCRTLGFSVCTGLICGIISIPLACLSSYLSGSNYHRIRITPILGRVNLHLILQNYSRYSPHTYTLDLFLGPKNGWYIFYIYTYVYIFTIFNVLVLILRINLIIDY